MTYLVIDWETVDPLIDTCGSGWPWGGVNIVGCSVYPENGANTWIEFQNTKDNKPLNHCKGLEVLKTYIDKADTLIAHNAQYDFGILKMLGIDINSKTLVDTMLLGKLFDNRHKSYSLDNLASIYLDAHKTSDKLGMFVRYAGLCVNAKGNIVRDLKQCNKWAKTHMDEFYDVNPKLLIEYALVDTDLTKKLYDFLISQSDWIRPEWIYRLSCVLKYLIQARTKGIDLSLDDLLVGRELLHSKEIEQLCVIKNFGGSEYNPNSGPQTEQLVKKLGIHFEVNKATGNAILNKSWLEKQTHPFCIALREYRRFQKTRRDFFDKLLTLGKAIHGENLPPRFKLYPEFNIFGAETGRFSGKNPNLQNIPARDELIGDLIRKCFIPREGENWYQMDYGQQEFRLFAHYCFVSGKDTILKLEYDKDPRKDYHQVIADLVGIKRGFAKTVNLMSLYGSGRRKQSSKLVEAGLTMLEAENVYDKYHDLFPSVKQFAKLAANTLKSRGFVKTILGRRLRLEKATFDVESGEWRTYDYQAISKVIQGSAADQMIEVIVKCWELNIAPYIMFSIHDQLCISSTSDEIPGQIRSVMLDCIKLAVPMIADIGKGANWAEAESIKH